MDTTHTTTVEDEDRAEAAGPAPEGEPLADAAGEERTGAAPTAPEPALESVLAGDVEVDGLPPAPVDDDGEDADDAAGDVYDPSADAGDPVMAFLLGEGGDDDAEPEPTSADGPRGLRAGFVVAGDSPVRRVRGAQFDPALKGAWFDLRPMSPNPDRDTAMTQAVKKFSELRDRDHRDHQGRMKQVLAIVDANHLLVGMGGVILGLDADGKPESSLEGVRVWRSHKTTKRPEEAVVQMTFRLEEEDRQSPRPSGRGHDVSPRGSIRDTPDERLKILRAFPSLHDALAVYALNRKHFRPSDLTGESEEDARGN